MGDNHFLQRDGSQERRTRRDSEDEIRYLMRAEERILQSISARMPLAEILCKICDALNLEIGNVISLACLRNDEPTGQATIGKSAGIFGLYKFCSASVVGGNEEELGSLEMYCCVPRRPFLNEIRLIERATCLAAVAIQRDNESCSPSTAGSSPQT